MSNDFYRFYFVKSLRTYNYSIFIYKSFYFVLFESYIGIFIFGIIHFSLANLYITKIRKYVGSREKRPTFLY